MKELDNFFNSSKIDKKIYNNSINNNLFNSLTQKIDTKKYRKLINQLFWLNMVLYRISFMSYFDTIFSDNQDILKRNNILVYFPFLTFSSEICRLVNDKYIYTSLLSTLARQMIEQICVVKEINYEKISDKLIIESMVESHNKHVGAKQLNIKELNVNNEGLLKVFKTNRKYGSLARKYNYYFVYNFFSGDIHHISTIDKIIPQCVSPSKEYNERYLKILIGLTKESILFVNSFCNKLSQKDIDSLNKYDFINISF